MLTSSFTHAELPRLGTRVLRMGVAGNYGLETDDIFYAAERGVGFWFWSSTFKSVTPALREILRRDREHHVVAAVGWGYTTGMVRRGVEKALRKLGIEQLDLYLLGWLGRGSFFGQGIQDVLVELKEEGKVRAVGTTIHDRPRAGQLARDSVLDAFMLRYNAKHPGAEQDVFGHLHVRQPLVISYTATSWRQLLKPISGIEMPAWPSPSVIDDREEHTPPPLSAGLCYRFCLTSPQVHVVLTGPKNRAQLEENLAALAAGPLSREEEDWVREYGRKVKARKRIPFL